MLTFALAIVALCGAGLTLVAASMWIAEYRAGGRVDTRLLRVMSLTAGAGLTVATFGFTVFFVLAALGFRP